MMNQGIMEIARYQGGGDVSARENQIVGIYDRLFGRRPKSESLSYWIESGVPIENLESAIRAGAQGSDVGLLGLEGDELAFARNLPTNLQDDYLAYLDLGPNASLQQQVDLAKSRGLSFKEAARATGLTASNPNYQTAFDLYQAGGADTGGSATLDDSTGGVTIGGGDTGGSATLDDSTGGVSVNTGNTDGVTLDVTGGNQQAEEEIYNFVDWFNSLPSSHYVVEEYRNLPDYLKGDNINEAEFLRDEYNKYLNRQGLSPIATDVSNFIDASKLRIAGDNRYNPLSGGTDTGGGDGTPGGGSNVNTVVDNSGIRSLERQLSGLSSQYDRLNTSYQDLLAQFQELQSRRMAQPAVQTDTGPGTAISGAAMQPSQAPQQTGLTPYTQLPAAGSLAQQMNFLRPSMFGTGPGSLQDPFSTNPFDIDPFTLNPYPGQQQ